MTVIRWNPVREITAWRPVTDFATEFVNMQREIDRMFDHFRGGVFEEGSSAGVVPAVDIVERETDFLVKIELPGVNKEDVKITVQNDVLTIKGEKKLEMEKKGDTYRRVERSYGIFQRSFPLPASVKADRIEATYENGVLNVVLPKAEEAKPKEIEVKVK